MRVCPPTNDARHRQLPRLQAHAARTRQLEAALQRHRDRRDPVPGRTPQRLDELARIEDALLATLRAGPDAADDGWQILNMWPQCDTLRRDARLVSTPGAADPPAPGLCQAFGDGEQCGCFALRPASIDSHIRSCCALAEIDTIRQRRKPRPGRAQSVSSRRQNNTLLITCKQGELEAGLQAETSPWATGHPRLVRPMSSALLYLDIQRGDPLARGKAVFRAAMNITPQPEARRRQFRKVRLCRAGTTKTRWCRCMDGRVRQARHR